MGPVSRKVLAGDRGGGEISTSLELAGISLELARPSPKSRRAALAASGGVSGEASGGSGGRRNAGRGGGQAGRVGVGVRVGVRIEVGVGVRVRVRVKVGVGVGAGVGVTGGHDTLGRVEPRRGDRKEVAPG